MHALSPALTAPCCKPSQIIDEAAPIGTIHDCPTCGRSFINDNGKWRNTYSVDRKTLQGLLARARVLGLVKGYR